MDDRDPTTQLMYGFVAFDLRYGGNMFQIIDIRRNPEGWDIKWQDCAAVNWHHVGLR